MVIGAVIAFCILILVLAFLFPRLSRHPERGRERSPARVGASPVRRLAGSAAGWRPFQTSSRAIAKSGSAGRRGRAKVDR